MVLNRKDLSKAFSPNKGKKLNKRRSSGSGTNGVKTSKPSLSGSTAKTKSDAVAETSIKVIVRVRPPNERECQDNFRTVVKVIDDQMLIFDPKEEENPFFYRGVVQKGRDLLKKQNKELQFVFDRVFDGTSSNIDVFEGSTKHLISRLLDGYNCSVFAYGATGAGKTHTMLGKEGDPGITYRTMAELFNQIELQQDSRNFTLGVSYLEIYNENVQDLLHKAGPLHLREDGRAGIIVAGLKIISICNADELLSLLAKGNKNRTQHATDANQESSRSHAVFQVYVNIINKLDGQVKQVKLSMIDLAGSERASATGCKGQRFKEGANINKSLLALGNCINNLSDGIKHIPYRDSKLTRLLKDSLGGNCQTVMIANVSPSSLTFEDTYNTLRYANRAKKIKTSVKKNIVNCQMHISGYVKMVEEQKKEIELLKQKILAFENGSAKLSITNNFNKDKEISEKVTKIINKIIDYYDRKKLLCEKILSLESSDKIMYCRILYKKAADERLQNLTSSVDLINSDEKNASGKLRVNKSLQYFKRQREGISMQLKSVWGDICNVEDNIKALHQEIESENLKANKAIEDRLTLVKCEIDRVIFQQQFEHAKKIIGLQQCEMESMHRMVKMESTTLQNYYYMMRGNGTMNDNLVQEFKHLVKSLEGIRNIKWSDMSMTKREEDFYSMTVLSTKNLDNPTNENMPCLLELFEVEEQTASENEIQLASNEGKHNLISAPQNNIEDAMNATITLIPNLVPLDEEIIQEHPETNQLNTTFSIQENKNSRKRVLSDSKNQVNSRSPAKTKKVSPKHVVYNGHSSVQNGKENSKEHQQQRPIISDKSIKILNKLKADRSKPVIQNQAAVTDEINDAALKAIRVKERRGLTLSTHPYQKANLPKTKAPPAWQF